MDLYARNTISNFTQDESQGEGQNTEANDDSLAGYDKPMPLKKIQRSEFYRRKVKQHLNSQSPKRYDTKDDVRLIPVGA